MLRIDPSRSAFTSVHLPFAQLAYTSNNLDAALPVIDSDLIYFPNMSGSKEAQCLCDPKLDVSGYVDAIAGQVKPSMILEYNLVRGLIYMAKRDWDKAQTALAQVVTHPTKDRSASKFMTEAHKKWILLGLLSSGKPSALPTYTSASARSTYNHSSKPYEAVASIFVKGDVSQLLAKIEEHRSLWETEGNASLINEVLSAFQKWQIVNLRKIFKSVSIADIRTSTISGHTGKVLENDQAVCNLVNEMIDSGMLKGKIETGNDGSDTFLEFVETDCGIMENTFAQEIARCHNRIEMLTQQYKFANEQLSGSKEYVRYMVREQKRQEKEGADAPSEFDSNVEDEDLMTGVVPHT